MREVVSLIVIMIIAAVVYEIFKPEKDYRSSNNMYDQDDIED